MVLTRVVVVVILAYFKHANGQGLCENVRVVGNIGYRYHQNECNEYIQCHTSTSGNTYAVYMSCPFGQHWSQVDNNCVDISTTSCALGTCTPSARIKDGGCRAYSACINRNHTHMCCEIGSRYMAGRCIPDFTCVDPCRGSCASWEQCRSYPHWGNPTFYYHYHREEGAVYERICPRGSHFDMVECGCVAPKRDYCATPFGLRFEGSGMLTQWQGIWSASPPLFITNGAALFSQSNILRGNFNLSKPSPETPLVIRLTYGNQAQGTTQTLFVTNDCKGCHQLKISLENQRFFVTLSKYNRDVAQIELPTEGFGEVVDSAVVYNGRELLAATRSNNLHYMKRTKAPSLTLMDCGMQISDASSPFRGTLQSVALYSCHHGGKTEDIFNLPNNNNVFFDNQ